MITIDSRGAGSGKTTTGIYPKLNQAILTNQPVLLVVPSVDLQNQYASQFAGKIHVINSGITDNVSHSIIERLKSYYGVTCITHEAFLRTSIPIEIKLRHHLIVDEVFNPYGYEEINLDTDSNWNPNLDFANVFIWQDTDFQDVNDQDYHRVRVSAVNQISFFKESAQWRRLTNPNTCLLMKYEDYKKLADGEKSKVSIITELDANILNGWLTVHLAGAAYEHTFMAQWIHDNDLRAKIEFDFKPHSVPLTIHMPKQEVSWSNNLRNNNPELVQAFYDYVATHTLGSVLYVKNNQEMTQLSDGIKLNHNVHGMNSYSHLTDVALSTALKPNNVMMSFFKRQLDMTDRQIHMAYAGYLFYQIIMRTSLRTRTPKPTNVFIIDYETAFALMDLFVPGSYQVIDNIIMQIPVKPPKPKKKVAKSTAERMRLYRSRKSKP